MSCFILLSIREQSNPAFWNWNMTIVIANNTILPNSEQIIADAIAGVATQTVEVCVVFFPHFHSRSPFFNPVELDYVIGFDDDDYYYVYSQ